MPRGRKISTPCKKRTLRKCRGARKSCTIARGPKRTYCRTARRISSSSKSSSKGFFSL